MNQLKAKIKRSLDWIYVEFNWWLFGPYEEVFDNDQVYYNSENKIYNLIKNFYPNVIFAYKKIQDLNLNDIKFLHIIDIHNRKDIHLKFENLNYIYSDLINKTIVINIDNKKITISQRTLDIINEEIEEIVEIFNFDKDIIINNQDIKSKVYRLFLLNNLNNHLKYYLFLIKTKKWVKIISKIWELFEENFIYEKDSIYEKSLKNYNILRKIIIFVIILLLVFIIILCIENFNIYYYILLYILLMMLIKLLILFNWKNQIKIDLNTFIKGINKRKLIFEEIKYIKSNYKKFWYNNISKFFKILSKPKKIELIIFLILTIFIFIITYIIINDLLESFLITIFLIFLFYTLLNIDN